jgi:hypothetical protein
MGDRTYVVLRILKCHEKRAKELFTDNPSDEWEHDDLVLFGFEEVNYGDLDFLRSLQEAGIAYESSWDAGNDYTSGTEYCRFTDNGKIIVKSIYDDEKGIEPRKLLAVLHDHEKLKQVILNFQEEVAVLPWDDQKDYGDKYRVLRLISAIE